MKTQLFGVFDRKNVHPFINCSTSLYVNFAILARGDYKNSRFNGDEKIDAPTTWTHRVRDDTSITWVRGKKRSDGYVYGKMESDEFYHYECRYDADAADLEWMRKTDCNYLTRILKAGQLKALEPDVYYLCLISANRDVADEIAKDFDIGKWWRTQVDKPNIADLLQSAQTVYEARLMLESTTEMLPELSKIIGEYVTVVPDKKEEKEVAVDPELSSSSVKRMRL